MWLLIGLAVLSADTTAEQAELLKTFRNEFVAITPGEGKFPQKFLQGEKPAPTAMPVHEVTMSAPFSMARYEVPQDLWEAVMGENPSRWKGPRNSVEMLTYEEAVEFCRKVTLQMREENLIEPTQEIRLPSESEWEYCCRAGTDTRYSFGNSEADLDAYGWYTGNAAGNDPPVGAKKPNAWGLYDMHGYLQEWCADTGHENYEGAPNEGGPWLVGTAAKRVVRGGSWKEQAAACTSGTRVFVPHETRDDAIGFRCVLANVPTEPTPFKPSAQEKFVSPDAKLEQLWGDGEFTEGPALAPDGSILFSDIGNKILRLDPATGKVETFREPSGRSNGLMFNAKGELLACEGANTGGGRRISITEGIDGTKDGTVRTLSQGIRLARFNSPNDLVVSPDGVVYFSDPRYLGDEPRELEYEAVFSVLPSGATSVAVEHVEKPNGLVLASSGRKLYVADNNPTGNKQLVVLTSDSDEAAKEFGAKEVLWDFQAGRGIDGMTMDVAGNIYATAGTGDFSGVYVFDPLGKPLAFIPTPGDPTNCCFGGGEDGQTLYITAAVDRVGSKYGLFRIPVLQRGYHVVKLTAEAKSPTDVP